MKIRNVLRRGWWRFLQHNDASGLAPGAAEMVRNILTFLRQMEDAQQVRDIPKMTGVDSRLRGNDCPLDSRSSQQVIPLQTGIH